MPKKPNPSVISSAPGPKLDGEILDLKLEPDATELA